MKIKNKLIPLIAPIAVFGTITPLTTLVSCKQEDSFEMRDLLHFTPDIQKREETDILNPETATKAYKEWLDEDSSAFGDDLAYGTLHNWQESLPPQAMGAGFWADLKKLEFGSSKPKFGMANVQYPGGDDQPYPTISIKTKLHAEFRLYLSNIHVEETIPTSTAYWIDYSIDVSSKLNNMLFFVKQHGLSTNPSVYDTRSKSNDNETFDAWNVTTFDRGNNSAYQYRTDDWSMDISSTCHRTITFFAEHSPTVIDERTNKFNACVDNAPLYNQIQNTLVTGNQLFNQLMGLNLYEHDTWKMTSLLEQLTGYRGTATDQFDILLYTASASTIDFVSFYLSGLQAKHSINTYQPLTCIPNLLEMKADDWPIGSFNFYQNDDNLDATPWSLEKPTPKKESGSTDEVKAIKKIVLMENLETTPSKSGRYMVISGHRDAEGVDNVIYSASAEDKKELVVPLKLWGSVWNEGPVEAPYYYNDCLKFSEETFYLKSNIMKIKIFYDGDDEPFEDSITIDQPLVKLYFKLPA